MLQLSPNDQALVLRFLGTGNPRSLLALRDEHRATPLAELVVAVVQATEEPPDPALWVETVAQILPTVAKGPSPVTLEDALLRLLFLAPWLPGLAADSSPELSAVAIGEALAIARTFSVTPLAARIDYVFGSALVGHDDARAEVHARKSSELYARLNDETQGDWAGELAWSLNVLGGALRAQGRATAAVDAFMKALRVTYRHRRPDHRIFVSDEGPLATVLSGFERSLATMSRALGDDLHVIALDTGEPVAAHAGIVERKLLAPQLREWWERVATYHHNVGDVLRELRRFEESRLHLRNALRARLRLAALDSRFRYHLVRTLINLGRALREEGRLERARRYLSRGLVLLPDLTPAGRATHEERGLLLQNLANVVGDLGEQAEAVDLARRAVDSLRAFAGEQPGPQSRGQLVAARIAHIAALVEGGLHAEARSHLPQALAEARVETADPSHVGRLAQLLSNSAGIFRLSGDEYLALAAADEAIALEASCEGAERQVLRGKLAGAYAQAVRHYARYGQQRLAYAYLAAFRAAAPKAIAVGDLDDAVEELASVSAELGRRVVVVTVQRTGVETLFGVVSPQPRGFAVELCGGLEREAHELIGTYQDLLVPQLGGRSGRRIRSLRELGEDVWKGLPTAIRDALQSDALVLISADPWWSNFPWELLKPPGRPFLGLTRVLSRWHAIDAAAIRRLRPVTRAVDSRSFALLCPLCGPNGEVPLKNPGAASMLREYGFVARELRRLGVSFSAEVNVLLGFQGKKTFFLRTLGEAPTLVHFVGHGYPAEGGSLLAWSHWADSATTIDSGDLREYRDSRKLAQLFARGGIAYLSCCFAGWERRHAGLGEDLCSTLLAEGLDVVVASHLPIYEASAGQLAKTFYQWLARLEVDAGTAVIKARRRMARAFDRSGDCALLSWASLRCTGNPLTSLTGGPRIVLPDRGRRPKARAGRPAAASGAVRRDSAPPTRSRESPAITFPPVRPSSASPDANPTTSTG